MLRLSKIAAVAAVAAAVGVAGAKAETTAQADAHAIALKADVALQNFRTDPKFAGDVASATRVGRAILIVPEYVRAGVGIGGAAGTGILMVKDGATWGAPKFFDVRAANLGPQLGYQKGDLLLVIANTDTLNAILSGDYTLSADAGVQAGTTGNSTAASTTTAGSGTGVVAFMRGEGAYAGATVGGAQISPNDSLNAVQLAAGDADKLRGALTRISGSNSAAR